jgi:CheY-like chemotaxis protein
MNSTLPENLPSRRPQKQPGRQVIFLAEDDHDDIMLFESALDTMNTDADLIVCINGNEAIKGLETAGAHYPDIVFLDINMPLKNGLECLKHIRNGISKRLPVFLFTTADDMLSVEEARKLGATGYLSKPASLKDLCTLLQNVLSIDWGHRSENDFYLYLKHENAY